MPQQSEMESLAEQLMAVRAPASWLVLAFILQLGGFRVQGFGFRVEGLGFRVVAVRCRCVFLQFCTENN